MAIHGPSPRSNYSARLYMQALVLAQVPFFVTTKNTNSCRSQYKLEIRSMTSLRNSFFGSRNATLTLSLAPKDKFY